MTKKRTPVCLLDCKKAFNNLNTDEKLYAHYMSKASWYGSLAVLLQVSEESPKIFKFLHLLFTTYKVNDLKRYLEEDELEDLLKYASNFFANNGNYLSFGFTKFVPDLSADKLESVLYHLGHTDVINLFSEVKDKMYSMKEEEKELGLHPKGISAYYTSNVTQEDVDLVKDFMIENKMEAWNTRLFKLDDGTLQIRLASSDSNVCKNYDFRNRKVQIVNGDYSKIMAEANEYLELALKYVQNSNQSNMLKHLMTHFKTGELSEHKDYSRYWVKDKGPTIETYVGFIENYTDPCGERAEFEGFVAMVDKDVSEKFNKLVDRAEEFLPLLPWSKDFEKDVFSRPDFTSLEVLTFASSGPPAGINIPNYDDVRHIDGFKNVSLGNVINSGYATGNKIPFLTESDQELYKKYNTKCFELHVGLHELLGHGSGKLLAETSDSKLNFNPDLINPETGSKVETWYKVGETYASKFGKLGSAYEECRAETVAIHLDSNKDILDIFGFHDEEANDIHYIGWLSMALAGLKALEHYSADQKVWKQAHCHARFAILNVLINAGNGLCEIEIDDSNNMVLKVNRQLIDTVGVTAVSDFLRKLNVYKATADIVRATQMFDELTTVNDYWLKVREIVVLNKKPRSSYVMCNTHVKNDNVDLVEYEASYSGLIQSVVERFSLNDVDDLL